MSAKKLALSLAGALVALSFAAAETQAAQRDRLDRKEVERLVSRIEKGANRFKKSVDSALDNSRYNQTRTETEINTYVREFENATDRLKKNTRRGDLSEQDAREVLRRGDRIDRFMDRVRLSARAESDWDSLRRELDQLPRLHRFAWQWGGRGRPGWRDSGYGDRDRDRDRGDWRDDDRRDNGRDYGRNDADIHGIVAQIEAGANRFRTSLGNALDEGRLNQTATERLITQYVREFENATDRLKRRVQSGQMAGADTREVLQRGDKIDGFMRSNRLNQRAQRDWTALRNDLDALARATRISWRWGGR